LPTINEKLRLPSESLDSLSLSSEEGDGEYDGEELSCMDDHVGQNNESVDRCCERSLITDGSYNNTDDLSAEGKEMQDNAEVDAMMEVEYIPSE
jgi:hypothetical protein